MKICFISKYPPIEGGISSRTYWLAKALGDKGHEIHIVTNAWEVETEYRENIDIKDLESRYCPRNVYVHNTVPFNDPVPVSLNPGYIPYANPYTAKLASLAIDVIRKHKLQLIDSWYILPYGIAGFLAKEITQKPQILRHAGSDIYRLMEDPYLKTIFVSIFKKVDKIITGYSEKDVFLKHKIPASKLVFNKIHNVDTDIFNPEVEKYDISKYTGRDLSGIPIITYIGKVGRVKGVYELIEAASEIKKDFRLLFVANGNEMPQLKSYIAKLHMQNKVLFINFVAPWQIPSIIKVSNSVVMLERDFPIGRHYSTLPKEVMAVGKCLIISKELYDKRFYGNMRNGKEVIIIDPKDITGLRSVLQKVVDQSSYADKIGRNGHIFSNKFSDRYNESFDSYVEETILLYDKLLSSSKHR